MTRNKLVDLNNHLFEQLERLNDSELSRDELEQEIERTKSMVGVSSQIIEISSLALKAEALRAEYSGVAKIPIMIGEYNE